MEQSSPPATKNDKKESPFVDLLVNIIIPAIIWTKFSNEDYLGPNRGFIVALAFPLIFGIYELFNKKKFNFLAMLGFVSVLLTGGIGLLKLDNQWYAIKEAAIPGIIGIMVLVSLRTPFPMVKKMIYNEAIIDVTTVNHALASRGNQNKFDRLLIQVSFLLAGSFFLSSTLNYALAKIIVVATPGTVAYNEQLGKMTALSYPVIVLPSMLIMFYTVWFLLRGIKKLTGLTFEQVFRGGQEKTNPKKQIPQKHRH